MSALPALPGCGQPATVRYELYSPRETLHGSLDGVINLCTVCGTAERVAELEHRSGLVPYRCNSPVTAGRRCGDGYDFLAGKALYAPSPVGEFRDQVMAAIGRLSETDAAEILAAAARETPAELAEHRTTVRQMPGGPIEVRCSCGKWGGVAPSYAAAEKSAIEHRRSAR